MADQHSSDLDLSHFWNDVTNGNSGDAADLDPETADAVRRLHHLASAPLPDAARERVWRGLMRPTTAPIARKEVVKTHSADMIGRISSVGLNGHIARSPASVGTRTSTVPRLDRGRGVAAIAFTLVVIVATCAWWVLGAPFPGSGDDTHAIVLAPLITPTATPDPATFNGVLVDAVLIDQPLTAQYIDVERLVFGPGDGFGRNTNVGSTMVLIVTAGEITVTVDGPTVVFKGIHSEAVSVEANALQRLNAGDALVWGPGTHFSIEHHGTTSATVVAFNILDPSISGPDLQNVTLWQLSQGNGAFAPGPLRMIVRRVTVPPGATYARPTAGPLLIFAPEDPNSGITGYLIGDATNAGKTSATMFVMTLEPVTGAPATPVANTLT